MELIENGKIISSGSINTDYIGPQSKQITNFHSLTYLIRKDMLSILDLRLKMITLGQRAVTLLHPTRSSFRGMIVQDIAKW